MVKAIPGTHQSVGFRATYLTLTRIQSSLTCGTGPSCTSAFPDSVFLITFMVSGIAILDCADCREVKVLLSSVNREEAVCWAVAEFWGGGVSIFYMASGLGKDAVVGWGKDA